MEYLIIFPIISSIVLLYNLFSLLAKTKKDEAINELKKIISLIFGTIALFFTWKDIWMPIFITGSLYFLIASDKNMFEYGTNLKDNEKKYLIKSTKASALGGPIFLFICIYKINTPFYLMISSPPLEWILLVLVFFIFAIYIENIKKRYIGDEKDFKEFIKRESPNQHGFNVAFILGSEYLSIIYTSIIFIIGFLHKKYSKNSKIQKIINTEGKEIFGEDRFFSIINNKNKFEKANKTFRIALIFIFFYFLFSFFQEGIFELFYLILFTPAITFVFFILLVILWFFLYFFPEKNRIFKIISILQIIIIILNVSWSFISSIQEIRIFFEI